jgi:hypothetical protein
MRSDLQTPALAVPSEARSGSRGHSDAEETARLKVAIACDREEVAASLGELRRRIHRALRWCRWLFHPVARIAIGLSLGFIVGRRRRARAR